MQKPDQMDELLAVPEKAVTTFSRLTHHEHVLLMHSKFGLPRPARPQLLSADRYQFRSGFLEEELNEFRKAHHEGDLAKAADGLVDLAYVAIGTAIEMGLPWDRLWDEVQRANLSKELGETDRGHALDLVKPEGWQPPDIEGVLAQWINNLTNETEETTE